MSRKVICPYCGQRAELVDSAVIYGRSYGNIYLCEPCDAYVGTHRRNNKPLGTLANKQLREWRKRAHRAFDPLWKSGKMTRDDAYKWLSRKMNLPPRKTHIGMFDIRQCKRVIKICREEGVDVRQSRN